MSFWQILMSSVFCLFAYLGRSELTHASPSEQLMDHSPGPFQAHTKVQVWIASKG